ncbi:MAG: S4 domain-containing protein [Gammaproteobacteria bacterium]
MRIQKVLSAAGVASRRQVEAWLVQGRLTVNGHPAKPGQPLGPRDVVALDGRRLRLAATAPTTTRVLAYHRSPGEPARAADAPEGTTPAEDRLPKVKGGRWLPLGAMAPSDGGLELFTTDGALRAAVSRHAGHHETHFSVRVRRLPDEAELARLVPTAAAGNPPFEVLELAAEPGEGANAWLQIVTRGARARDLRAALGAIGIEVGRLLRTRFLGYAMPRNLARGRYVELDEEAVAALCALVDYAGLTAAWQSKEPPDTPRPAGPRRKR